MARRQCTTRTPISAMALGPNADTRPGRISLVHNGIIENHDELRAALQAKGYVFASQTDTEVIAHLVDSLYDGDLFEAVKASVKASCRVPTVLRCFARTNRTA
jgi:glucosamine 6-phosphate synthetase-like amidotransferase/phosphosugar isomerase protein